MLLDILMIIFGVIAIFKGEFKITNSKKVKGSTSRTLGALLLLGVLVSLLTSYSSLVLLGTLILVIIIGLTSAEKIEDTPPPPTNL